MCESHLGKPMDVLANMLITIKNGGSARKETVLVPFSKFKASVAKALLDAGYIGGYEKKDRQKGGAVLEIQLQYDDRDQPKMTHIKRISKPSRRLYAGVKDIYEVKHGRGLLFLSTPKGILTGDQAKTEQVGGELLFELW